MTGQEGLVGVKEGDVLAGKYRVDRVLGVGGMGVVVAAHHLQLDDPVAIKFLLPDTLGNKEAVARFAREARAAVKIKSEHVARVTDVGKLENGAPYMVMEYLEGGDLSTWVSHRGALPVEQAVDFLLQACEAIAEAHALGIVHRDLKPANLFVARLPGGVQSVKVLDFGISKLTGLSGSGSQSSATKTSTLMGSPLYMSPEQMQSSKDVDARGDIWALGVILYELVTGKSPFLADTMPELILKIMSSEPPPLRNLRPDAPDGLEAVILRCIEKDRGRRYQTVGEFSAALLPFGSKRARGSVDRISQVMQAAGMQASALALPPSSGGVDAAVRGAGTAAAFGATKPGAGKTRPVMLGAVALLAVLAVGAVALRGHGSTAAGAPSAEPSLGAIPTASTPEVTQGPIAAPRDRSAPAAAAASPATPSASVAPPARALVAAHSSGPSPAHLIVPPRAAPLAMAPAAMPGPGAKEKPAMGAAVPAPPPQKPAAPSPSSRKPSAGSLIDDRR